MVTKNKRKEATAARRRLILTAAATCFIERGFHQTSIRDIAQQAGISLGNLYNHFDGKEALIAEIASLEREEQQKLEDNLADIPDPGRALETFIEEYAAYCARLENAALAAEIIAEAIRNPGIAAGYLDNRNRLLKMVTSLIEATTANGTGSSLPLKQRAEFTVDLIEGLAERCAYEERMPGKADLKSLSQAVRLIVAGGSGGD